MHKRALLSVENNSKLGHSECLKGEFSDFLAFFMYLQISYTFSSKMTKVSAYDGLIPQNQFARQMLSKTYDNKIQNYMTYHHQHVLGGLSKEK